MKEISKQLDNDLSKVFFNSVEEMSECYGIDAELPRGLHSNAVLVCYEIVIPFVFDYMVQYVFTRNGFYYLNNLGEPVTHTSNRSVLELEAYENDIFEYEGRCFVYVRVNEYLRKHLEKTLIGCEFVCKNGGKYISERRVVKSIRENNFVCDQDGFCTPLENILLYPDDYSDPIPYKEWVNKINEQDVEG